MSGRKEATIYSVAIIIVLAVCIAVASVSVFLSQITHFEPLIGAATVEQKAIVKDKPVREFSAADNGPIVTSPAVEYEASVDDSVEDSDDTVAETTTINRKPLVEAAVVSELEAKGSSPVMIAFWDDVSVDNAMLESTIANVVDSPEQRVLISNSKKWFATEIKDDDLNELLNDPNIKGIYFDRPVHTTTAESFPLIGHDLATNFSLTGVELDGEGQTVCIIDSGVDYTHEALGADLPLDWINGISRTKVIDGWNFAYGDNDPFDDYGHGTTVAGAAAGNAPGPSGYKGIAPEASIVAIKVLDDQGDGSLADVIAGMEWCVNNASVLNISVILIPVVTDWIWTSPAICEGSLYDIQADAAVAAGISVYSSTGNNGSIVGEPDTACSDSVYSVTAVKDGGAGATPVDTFPDLFLDGWTPTRAPHMTDFAMPGHAIYTTRPGNQYSDKVGTSIALPHMVIDILLRQYYEEEYSVTLTPAQIRNIFTLTGVDIWDNVSAGTYIRPDIFMAINYEEWPPTVTLNTPDNAWVKPNPTLYYTPEDNEHDIDNCTLYVNGNPAQTISSVQNAAQNSFSTTITSTATWQVKCYDTATIPNEGVSAVYTINIDNDNPNVNLENPADSHVETTTNTITFEYNVNDPSTDIDECRLYANGQLLSTDTSVTEGVTESFIEILNNDVYSWYVECDDEAGNTGTSVTRTLTVNANNAPNVDITAPNNDDEFVYGEQVTMECQATDIEDGNLNGNSVQWSSDIDGFLGYDDFFQTSSLSLGYHTITVTAMDSGSLIDTDKINLLIKYCTDTDGMNFYTLGTASNGTHNLQDQCFERQGVVYNPVASCSNGVCFLREYHCSAGRLAYTMKSCDCNNGVCLTPDTITINDYNPPGLAVNVDEGQYQDFDVQAGSTGGPLQYRWFVDALMVGNSDSYRYEPDYSDSGVHIIRVVVYNDYDQEDVEWTVDVKEANGCGGSGSCGTPAPGADVIVENLQQLNTAVVGQFASFRFDLVNIGTDTANGVYWSLDTGESVIDATASINMPPGHRQTVYTFTTYNTGGAKTVVATGDSTNAVTESDEGNNQEQININVT